MSCSPKSQGEEERFPRLSASHTEIEPLYDVIIVGSGYGASIAASRCARAGQKVCVLERGKEWRPGEFPESLTQASKNFQMAYSGKADVIGDPTDLYEAVVSKDITVVQGCGLGGGSLINAAVGLDADPKVFEDTRWPQEIRDDLEVITEVDRAHVIEMLRPTVYPDNYPRPAKFKAMEKAAKGLGVVDVEDIGKVFKKVPLFINFDNKNSPESGHRFDQPACIACGNCCSGCNTGAKNTLNMNYLPDAKAFGAKIFTEVSVISVQRDPYASLWNVYYRRHVNMKGLKQEEQIVRATHVILGAGALGSTKILLKSKQRGLEVSDSLGHNFTGNGDALGFSYHGKDVVNSVGVEKLDNDYITESSPGPCITSVIDLRHLPGLDLKDGMIIEDGTPPGASKTLLKVVMAFANRTLGVKTFPPTIKMSRIAEKLKGTDIDKTLAFLCMSHDDSSGVIHLDEKSGSIKIDWKDVGKQKIFEKINERLLQISKELEGTFIINPTWSSALHNELVTVHPLGGCPMGECGKTGVVNHKGQVFFGDTDDVHPGLYVMDGSILPTCVGVNPALTISIITERCVRLLIQDAGWTIDYDTVRDYRSSAISKKPKTTRVPGQMKRTGNGDVEDCSFSITLEFEEPAVTYTAPPKPGIRFSERMAGKVKMTESGEVSDCSFSITVEGQDVEQFLNDQNHQAEVAGTVLCPILSKEPLSISSGVFNFLRDSQDIVEAKEMLYRFTLTSSTNESYYFFGKKIIKADHVGETGLVDTTTLFVDIKNSPDDSSALATGILKISFKDFSHQLQTIEIINTKSDVEKLKWQAKFGNFFAKTLWQVYGSVTHCKIFDQTAPPRKKRPLNTNGITPEIHKVVTEDKIELRLTRYKGGGKGPLIAVHGLGTSSILFTLDTIPVNFLEYFLKQSYDVWLLDARLSTACPWVSTLPCYSLDDVAKYDYPAAVDKVLQVTGKKDLEILAHCVCSIALWGSILSGRLKGKLRAAIFSQAMPLPEGAFMNKLKSKFHMSNFMANLGIKTVTANAPKTNWLSCVSKSAANHFTSKDQHCSSDACHRITFFYGLIYEHANFNILTHDTLHELFGTASAGYFNHLSKIFRLNRMVDDKGRDVYVPGMDKNGVCTHTQAELEWISNLDFPMLLFCGVENESFMLRSVEKMHKVLKNLHPGQDIEYHAIPGYGHVDHFIGKNACLDVWPGLLRFLDKYAENDVLKDKSFLKSLKRSLSVRLVPEKKKPVDFIPCVRTTSLELKSEKEIRGSPMPSIDEDSSDSSDSSDSEDGVDLEDAPRAEEPDLRQKIDDALRSEKILTWKKKKVVKSSLHQTPEYKPPTALPEDEEQIFIEKVLLSDATLKREIYVLSDLHLGGQWIKDNVQKIKDFLFPLAKVAERFVHAIVLLGDVFEMWMTPISMTPPSPKELAKTWKEDKDMALIIKAIRKMAEEDEVRVYYVRGNHDHEMNAECVRELFGEKVRFIPGKLIYLINTGSQEYRIRFEHGHDYDLFNSFGLAPEDSPLRGKPIGYYISRCAQSSKDNYFSDTEMIIQESIKWFLSRIPNKVIGSSIADILSKDHFQKRLVTTMFQNALDLGISPDACILLDDGNWVRIMELIKYPFIKLAVKKYGSSKVFSMLESSLGNFGDFLAEMSEDVIVLAHTHIFKNLRFSGKQRRMHYVNTGTWIDLSEHFSYVKIVPPKRYEDGVIQMEYNPNKGQHGDKK